MTFLPERLYLTQLLKYASNEASGSLFEISEETGIPTGESTGKVKPHIDYAVGMGLIQYSLEDGRYKLVLTTFGKSVWVNDPRMNEPITQWLSHAHLCDPYDGAEAWFQIFTNWNHLETKKIGSMTNKLQVTKTTIRPLLKMYQIQESFGKIQVINEVPGGYSRTIAPIIRDMDRSYGVLILELLEKYFPGREQVGVGEFEEATLFSARFGWDSNEAQKVFDITAGLGFIKKSELVFPLVIQALRSSRDEWFKIYDDLI
jgi:hypothetical protein